MQLMMFRNCYNVRCLSMGLYQTCLPKIFKETYRNKLLLVNHSINYQININRFVYRQHTGVKGMRSRKFKEQPKLNRVIPLVDDERHLTDYDLDYEDVDQQESSGKEIYLDETNVEYDTIACDALNISKNIDNVQNVLLLQPFIKWGPNKSSVSPDLKLQEAEALIRSIPSWSLVKSMKIPLLSFDKKSLFGSGKLDELNEMLKNMQLSGNKISTIFISKSTLTRSQKHILEELFRLPILDRYSVVIQILRLHAKSSESKIQVAMAELPYIWSQMRDQDGMPVGKSSMMLSDSQKNLLQKRERKLKMELERIRGHRQLLRKNRINKNFPIIAVVGYTNAGKTSLIKALTKEETIQPRNQLFATLDVTAHAGFLPSNLQVIYMDTVGFMSDIPTGLIECFVATLEDAMLADLIIHVQDVSHENWNEQRKHVERTLQSLLNKSSSKANENENLLKNIINVGNKCDLIGNPPKIINDEIIADNLQLISSTTGSGIENLQNDVEQKILQLTNRRKMIIKVKMGNDEIRWLYKNCAVIETNADPENNQMLLLHVIISDIQLNQFKHYFLGKNAIKR